jgi:hypothetical protein
MPESWLQVLDLASQFPVSTLVLAGLLVLACLGFAFGFCIPGFRLTRRLSALARQILELKQSTLPDPRRIVAGVRRDSAPARGRSEPEDRCGQERTLQCNQGS